MSLEIVFSPLAKQTLLSTATFIKNKWGNSTSERFKKRVEKILLNISKHPYIFKATEFDESVRIGLVTKQCSVLYQIMPDKIEILFFWDNRQEPFI